jgi:hypothetical protein
VATTRTRTRNGPERSASCAHVPLPAMEGSGVTDPSIGSLFYFLFTVPALATSTSKRGAAGRETVLYGGAKPALSSGCSQRPRPAPVVVMVMVATLVTAMRARLS